jgi:hypothetical protein
VIVVPLHETIFGKRTIYCPQGYQNLSVNLCCDKVSSRLKKFEFGGLGIPNLADMNLCLLASSIKRYHLDNDKMWKQIIDHKYKTDSPNVFACRENGISPFWKGVMWAAKAAKMGYQWKVGNGRKVKFWEDH